MELINKVKREWEYHANGYSNIIKDELNSFRPQAWLNLIEEQIGYKKGLNILDIGCGPGFFSIILSKAGHNVVVIDCSENMLEQAVLNAKENGVNPKFIQMDNHNLEFEDNTFDLIINRNVTWTLIEPVKAYKEWHRVLKPKGKLLIFDANWFLDKYDEELKIENDRRRKLCIEEYGSAYKSFEGPEEYIVKEKFPLEDKIRPRWDEITLSKIGFKNLLVERNIIDKVWDEKEKLLYGATPMFMISAQKTDENCAFSSEHISDSIKKYWTNRSQTYSEQNNAELQCNQNEIWTQTILENVDKKGCLKVLDIGCGPGEFSILMAKAGHNVTGVDMTEAMLEKARLNAQNYNVDVDFVSMDVQNLQFEDDTFDLIISRNVTWNLQEIENFFKGCRRILKKDGRMVYFDANWYLYLYDEQARKDREESDIKYKKIYKKDPEYAVSNVSLTNVSYGLPLSKEKRPEWDRNNLSKFGFKIIRIDENINQRVFNEEEQVRYSATPMFTVVAQKEEN